MSRKVFAIRPQPGLAATIAAARTLGLDIFGEPLFEIQPIPWSPPDPGGVDALLIGSANAIRHGGQQLDRLRNTPVHAVGQTTAAIAHEAGFAVEQTGEGGLQSLIDAQLSAAGAPLRYLRLSGSENVSLKVPAGMQIEERIVYRAAPLTISSEFEKHLRFGGVVMLHSAAAARHFTDECARLGVPTEKLLLAALGPRISAPIEGNWANLRHANTPNDAALLALVKDMCQDR